MEVRLQTHPGIVVRLEGGQQGVEVLTAVETHIPVVVVIHLELVRVLGLNAMLVAR